MENTGKKVINGLKSQTVVTVILAILQLSYFSIMSRLLTTEDFGYFAVITAVTTIFNSLSEVGLGASIIQRKNITVGFIHTAFTLSIILGLVFMLLLIVSSHFLSSLLVNNDRLTISFSMMSITLLLCSVNSVMRALFVKDLHFMKNGLLECISFVLSSVIGILMAIYGCAFYSIIVAILFNDILRFIMFFIFCRSKLGIAIEKSAVNDILNYGGWLTASSIIRNIANQIDKFVLTSMWTVSMVGLYNRPSGLIHKFSSITNGIFDTVLFPILSNFQDEKEKIRKSYILSNNLLSFFAFIAAYVLVLGSDLIIDLFLGNKWIDLEVLMQLCTLMIIFFAFSRINDCFFRSLGMVKELFIVRVILCVVTAIGLVIGSKFGLNGAVIGLIVGRLIENISKFTIINRMLNVSGKEFCTGILHSIGLISILFVLSYAIKSYFDCGIISLISFVIFSLASIAINPHLLGQDVFQQIYLPIKEKLQKVI